MKIDFKINMQDVNSDYINKEIEQFGAGHEPGVSVIQAVDVWHESVVHNIGQVASNTQLIVATTDEAVYERIPEGENLLAVRGTVEDAKLYVKFSHFIILAAHQKIDVDNYDFSWQKQDVILCGFEEARGVDSRIYKHFYDTFDHLEEAGSGYGLYDKLVKENTVLLPSAKLFVHEFSGSLNLRMNIWLQQLLAIASLRGELKKSESVTVCKELDRGFPESAEELLIMISRIDAQLQKRYDSRLTDMLNHFNKQLTVPLKNKLDRGELEKETLISDMKKLGIKNIFYKALNKGDAKKLVLAYCFPPYNDTSGNVMAKRIHESGEIVDIISNNMDRIRTKDEKLLNLVSELLDSQIMLDGPQAFSSWGSIESYMHNGYQQFLNHRSKYEEIYSRAMFTQSHFLGYEIKKNNPELKWVAEFSDPLHKDVNAEMRYAPVEDDDYIGQLKADLDPKYHALINDNVFNLCEVLPFIYADELIFTNTHQLQYMIERFDSDLRELVLAKATVSQHPTPPKPMYSLVQSYYKLDATAINLAYFGNFYDTRGFRQIELVAKQLYDQNINNFRIHVFTNLRGNTMRFYNGSDFKDYITLNPYVSYFEFLNLAERLDILMIFDAETVGIKPYNPYVPSKLSDYRGSSSFVWAFTEPGSILDATVEERIAITRQHEYHEYVPTFKTLAGRLNKDLYRADMITCSK
ncbi:hypothetical protein [Salinicoccus halodurans]|uniref:Uncharacterized protein n=1 Tax=Salinicoccus halodurans TaxID=407035 RepID=A0AA94KWH9_9STAP|nr:hypothetical protein [Salinicoccus halodurans]SFK81278.1 hypothetical protein SAMN05216235_1778 [Salinicoccus halodurans]